MSASSYTRRINVQTQARNGKVQYPGGRAVYNPIWATCGTNPNFSVLKYVPVSLRCSLPGIPCPPPLDCTVSSCSILNGGFSTGTFGCIFDGGSSLSEYSRILEGGNSTNNCSCNPSNCDILNAGNSSSILYSCLFDGGSSLNNYQRILEGGTSGNNCTCNPSNCDVLNAGNSSSILYSCLFDGGSSSDGYTNILLGGTSSQVCN